jgi:hypothetical protein
MRLTYHHCHHWPTTAAAAFLQLPFGTYFSGLAWGLASIALETGRPVRIVALLATPEIGGLAWGLASMALETARPVRIVALLAKPVPIHAPAPAPLFSAPAPAPVATFSTLAAASFSALAPAFTYSVITAIV